MVAHLKVEENLHFGLPERLPRTSMTTGSLSIAFSVVLCLLPGTVETLASRRHACYGVRPRYFSSTTKVFGNWGLPPPEPSESFVSSGKVVLGVDYGTRNVGVAASAGWSPRPLTVLKHLGNDTAIASRLLSLAYAELAELIVVGMPFDKDGTETFQAQLTRDFARLLSALSSERGGPGVVLVDERFSSAGAQARMQHEKHANMLERLDAEAACVILEGYYSDRGVRAETVPPDMTVLEAARYSDLKRQRQASLEAALAKENEMRRRTVAQAKAAAEDALADSYRVDPTFDISTLGLENEIARRAAELGD